ncbi:MAG: bifunctional riboflavin kinase/FAD synthetase [Bacteroidaceae bacterium]|nr:bifunctional riboflavin kinase/FAD synthetase [Bacteroidaceae bacterium]
MSHNIATIGFFDGVHRGHLCLIAQLREIASQRALTPMLITFDRHPRQVVETDSAPQLLSTLDEKRALLQSSGVEHIEILPFTEELSRMTAKDFMCEVLMKRFGVAALVMGYNHRFGHGGGTAEQYMQWGQELGLEIVMAHALEGERVSSSLIRESVRCGNMAEATYMLGHPYVIQGVVVEGHKVGRLLGYPTANLQVPSEKLLPACGVYAVRVLLPDGTWRKGVLNVGNRPTIQNGNDVSVEVFLIDFIGDLYHSKLQVQVVQKLRDERQFTSTDELRRHIESDCHRASVILDAE